MEDRNYSLTVTISTVLFISNSSRTDDEFYTRLQLHHKVTYFAPSTSNAKYPSNHGSHHSMVKGLWVTDTSFPIKQYPTISHLLNYHC